MAFLPGFTEPTLNGRGSVFVGLSLIHSDASGTYTIPVPAGHLVKSVAAITTEAFDGTGTAMTIGDGADADGFLDDTDLALATAATATTPAVKLAKDSSNPYAAGKFYAVADTIDVAFTQGTTPTTGCIKIVAELVSFPNIGIPAGAASTATL